MQDCNKQALENIINDYGKMVTSICRRMIYNEKIAEEAAQESWIQIIKNLPSFKGDSKLSTWIYTITARTVSKYIKNEKELSIRDIKAYSHGPQFEYAYNEDTDQKLWVKEMCYKCLTGTLQCLDNEARLIYIFRDVAQLGYDEISLIVNKDESAIRKIMSRSRKKLRSYIDDECMIVNPDKCRCRLKRPIKNLNLDEEYNKIRSLVWKMNLYKAYEIVLPEKNYWEKHLN